MQWYRRYPTARNVMFPLVSQNAWAGAAAPMDPARPDAAAAAAADHATDRSGDCTSHGAVEASWVGDLRDPRRLERGQGEKVGWHDPCAPVCSIGILLALHGLIVTHGLSILMGWLSNLWLQR